MKRFLSKIEIENLKKLESEMYEDCSNCKSEKSKCIFCGNCPVCDCPKCDCINLLPKIN